MTTRRGDPRGTTKWKQIRLTILARDQYICAYCGQPANTVDHIQALQDGGDPYHHDNLIAACNRCNVQKAHRTNATLNKTIFPRTESTFLLAKNVSLPGGFGSGLNQNCRDVTVNVLGSVPFE